MSSHDVALLVFSVSPHNIYHQNKEILPELTLVEFECSSNPVSDITWMITTSDGSEEDVTDSAKSSTSHGDFKGENVLSQLSMNVDRTMKDVLLTCYLNYDGTRMQNYTNVFNIGCKYSISTMHSKS